MSPCPRYALATYYIVAPAEASSNLARYDGDDAYYLRAQKLRALILRDFTDAFEKVDALVTPTTHRRLRHGREDGRPRDDVSQRRLHRPRQHGRNSWTFRPGGPGFERPAPRPASVGQALRRGNGLCRGGAAIEKAANFTTLPSLRAGVAS